MGLMTIFAVKVGAMTLEGELPTGDEVMQEGRDWILLNGAQRTAAWIKDRYGDVRSHSRIPVQGLEAGIL